MVKLTTHHIVFNDLERISHILMLNSPFLKSHGFYEGKIGVAVALAELFRYTSEDVYYDYMSDLLDDILGNIYKGLGFDFKSGLSGIGWGIEYLIQNNFVNGESVEICEEIDCKIMEVDPRRISDYSLENGFEGLLHYLIYHLQGAIIQKSNLPFDVVYLSDINSVCKTLENKKISNTLRSLSNIYISFIKDRTISGYNVGVVDFATDIVELGPDKLSTYPLGLNNGLAGLLLHIIKENAI